MRTTSSRSRRTVQVGSVGLVTLLAGLVPGTGVASATRTVVTDIAYSCAFPSGSRPVEAAVTVTLPVTTSPGTVIQPADVSVSLAVPRAVLTDLPRIESPVSGTVALATEVTQRGASTEVGWQGLGIRETPVGEEVSDDIELEASGEVPTITPQSSGDIVFTAGRLDLTLAGATAGAGSTAEPAPAISCTTADEKRAELGTVGVPAERTPQPAATEPSTAGPLPESVLPDVTPRPGGTSSAGEDDDIVPGKAQPPEGCRLTPGNEEPTFPDTDHFGDGYIAGYSNAAKLNGAMLFKEPGLLRVRLNHMGWNNLQCPQDTGSWIASDATLNYKGKPQMPPAEATFLTFGFMPTSAKVEMSLDGKMDIGTIAWNTRVNRMSLEETVAVADMWVRLYDVKVNGQTLDVGAKCRTVRPMRLELRGKGAVGRGQVTGYTVAHGGPLTGVQEIPPFSGCGVTEDLDALFTASISGKGNYVKMMQAPLCVDGVEANCPAVHPTPER